MRASSIFPDDRSTNFPRSRLLSYDDSEILTLNFATGELMDHERYWLVVIELLLVLPLCLLF